jgi:ribosomal protein S18 acetylase RimI-like enzyme
MTNFRRLDDDDNVKKLAHWIYAADVQLFNSLYTNKTNSLEAIVKLIMSDYINPYHRKFITLVYDDNPKDIQALGLSFKGSEITVNETYNAFDSTGFTSVRNSLLYEYISVLVASGIKRNDYYLSSIYVDTNHRKKYIGSKLVENIKQKARQSNSNNLYVDVSEDKSSLIDFYGRLDFEKSKFNYHTLIGRQYGYITMVYKIK